MKRNSLLNFTYRIFKKELSLDAENSWKCQKCNCSRQTIKVILHCPVCPQEHFQQRCHHQSSSTVELQSTASTGDSSKNTRYPTTADEPPHQICSYTLLFLLFLHFPYIADPPLRTSAPTRLCSHDNRTCSIGPISLIWWTYDLRFTCIYFYS